MNAESSAAAAAGKHNNFTARRFGGKSGPTWKFFGEGRGIRPTWAPAHVA